MGAIGAGNLGSAYPSALDTLLYEAGGVSDYENAAVTLPDNKQRMDAEVLNDVLDAIIAIQTTLGINPQDVYTDVDARLDAIAGAGYTDEQAQDAIGTILTDSASVDFTYNDATPSITAVVLPNTTVQKVEVVKNSGAVVGTRKQLNFIEGSNVTLTIADDAGNDQVDITIAGSVSGYTDEQAQDAVGSILVDTATIDVTYDDATPQITMDVIANTTNQKVRVSKNSGAVVGTRRQINFIEGSNVTLTIADDAGDDEVDVTINASAPGTGDVVGPSSAVDAEIVLFDSTTGKLIKRATGSGIVKATSGVYSTVTAPTGAIVGTTDTQTLTNKTVQPRVVTVADATSITPNADTTDVCEQINTQGAGTLTLNAPTGTPYNRQKMEIVVDSTNIHTLSFNAIYRGSTDLTLPTATSGSGKTDYMLVQYHSTDAKWDMLSKNFGF